MTVSASDNWAYSFDNLDKYKDGNLIEYTIEKEDVTGYTATVSGYNVINTLETTSVTAVKYWNDNGNQDGKRAEYAVTITGTAAGATVYTDTRTLSAETTGYTWNSLPKYYYDASSNAEIEIIYTVEETTVPDGYTATCSTDANTGVITITNTHTPETTSVSVTKVWDDSSDKDNIRPDSVTITLLADGAEVGTAELSESNSWTYEWTGLAKYSSGTEIVYTVEEQTVPSGYTAEISGDASSGFTVTNTHTPSEGPRQTYTNLIVRKIWVDEDDADGLRPSSVTVALYQNGVATGRTVTLSETNNWTASFTNLPVRNGSLAYSYIVVEVDVPDGYSSFIRSTGDWSYTVTNTHIPEDTLDEPEEDTNTETEDDEAPSEPSEPESNPITGLALSVLPMVIAALAATASKRR